MNERISYTCVPRAFCWDALFEFPLWYNVAVHIFSKLNNVKEDKEMLLILPVLIALLLAAVLSLANRKKIESIKIGLTGLSINFYKK